jgi:hypothetical protein
VDVYRRTVGHDYFRRRVAILNADGGHLHYLIQVDPDFGLLVGREFQNHRGILLLRSENTPSGNEAAAEHTRRQSSTVARPLGVGGGMGGDRAGRAIAGKRGLH